MGWPDYAIWWQVYPLGFTGAYPADLEADEEIDWRAGTPAAPAPAADHRLDRLLPWLDYAVELGCSGLALGPIFESNSHGYDTIDHFRIDHRLGDEAAFDRLVTAAHARGLRIMLDGVFNHVGRGFAKLRQAQAEGPDSDAAAWFRPAPPGPDWPPGFAVFEGNDDLVVLNHDSPAVADHVANVMSHWLARGADAWNPAPRPRRYAGIFDESTRVVALLNLADSETRFDVDLTGLRAELGGWDGWESVEPGVVPARSWAIFVSG